MSATASKTMYDMEMHAWLVTVHTQDVYEYFAHYAEALAEAKRLSKMNPVFKVGIYRLETAFEEMH